MSPHGTSGVEPSRITPESGLPPAIRPRSGALIGIAAGIVLVIGAALLAPRQRSAPEEMLPPGPAIPPPDRSLPPFLREAELELTRRAGRDSDPGAEASGVPPVPVGPAGREYSTAGIPSGASAAPDPVQAAVALPASPRQQALERALAAEPVQSFAAAASSAEGSRSPAAISFPDASPLPTDLPPLPTESGEYGAFLAAELERVRRGSGAEGTLESGRAEAAAPPPLPVRALEDTPGRLPPRQTSSRASGARERLLPARTLVSARLITAIDSDLPGQVSAQVTRDVYDAEIRSVLVPRGSFLLGRYDDQVALGQNRVVVSWTRLELPDGRGYELPGLPTTDAAGGAGLPGRVDNHYREVFGGAALLSLISAGVQLSQPAAGFGQPATAQQQLAGAMGLELGRVATEVVRRNLQIRPVVRVAAGTELRIFVGRDLLLPPYPR